MFDLNDICDADRQYQRYYGSGHLDGGAGSGNWGHAGRPGKRGGSGKGGGTSYRLSTPDGGYAGLSSAYKENEEWKPSDIFKKRKSTQKAANKAEASEQGERETAEQKTGEQFPELRPCSVVDRTYISLIENAAMARKVMRREVKRLTKPLTESQIIAKVSRLDQTGGSCVSAALAYVGNKFGFDVTDFRGGESRMVFRSRDTTRLLYRVSGVKSQSFVDKSAIKAGRAALASMEEGKEYILHVGEHCSVVRLKNGQQQYLELQSKDKSKNRWTGIGSATLNRRFHAESTKPKKGSEELLDQEALIVDISTLGTAGLKDVLAYINTVPIS